MNFLTKLFLEIEEDFIKAQYKNMTILSRKLVLQNGVIVIVYFNKKSKIREVSIKLINEEEKNMVKELPKLEGFNFYIGNINSGEDEGVYLVFKQLEDYEAYIYEVVMADLIKELENLNGNKFIKRVKKLISKWNKFFILKKEIIISDIKQQGLYGELFFLRRLILEFGEYSLGCWTGCNLETHDFYVKRNGIELKTTSVNGNYKVKINNEYQLDNTDVNGKLFLVFISLRKSTSDGETLEDIVNDIDLMFGENLSAKHEFKDLLFKYGYLKEYPEIYKFKYNVREVNYYEIREDFPRITRYDLYKGISNVHYMLNLDICKTFLIEENQFYRIIEG